MKDISIIVWHRTTDRLFLCFLLCWMLGTNSVQAQTDGATAASSPFYDLTLEWQVYPTGTIPGIRIERSIGQRGGAHLRLGYNMVRHRDLGVQDDEKGGGFGFSLGYRHFLRIGHRGWFGGIRSDVWFNKVEWKDKIDTIEEESGTTDLVVLQPTAEAGYLFTLKNNWILAPTIAFGAEINIVTEGKEVGQGAILLLGIQIGKRFGR